MSQHRVLPNTVTTLIDECEALLVPHATPLKLTAGTEICITQALGDSVTAYVGGNLVRISSLDWPALGLEALKTPDFLKAVDQSQSLTSQCWQMLKQVYDPEIPVNIVDLGLIYGVNVFPLDDSPEFAKAHIVMTLTAPTCGMGPVLVEDVKRKLLCLPKITTTEVELVFDPPWSQDNMSEAAMLSLGLL